MRYFIQTNTSQSTKNLITSAETIVSVFKSVIKVTECID